VQIRTNKMRLQDACMSADVLIVAEMCLQRGLLHDKLPKLNNSARHKLLRLPLSSRAMHSAALCTYTASTRIHLPRVVDCQSSSQQGLDCQCTV